MSERNSDAKNRWRTKITAFRMSPEEAQQLECFVKLSGLNKQDYLINRVLDREIVVQGNSRTFKAVKNLLIYVLEELKRIDKASNENQELFELIDQINKTIYGFKNTDGKGKSPYVDA